MNIAEATNGWDALCFAIMFGFGFLTFCVWRKTKWRK